jgi:hypothetical protein
MEREDVILEDVLRSAKWLTLLEKVQLIQQVIPDKV